ncbi:DsbA family protein [Nocardioides kribbensis]|uniref:DsbA family protein n=1 Tax=Nocardioides kribbensis TaxID=305517 RepID=UPI0032D9DA8E
MSTAPGRVTPPRRRRPSRLSRVLTLAAGGFLAVVAALVVLTVVSGGGGPTPTAQADVPLVRQDSHYLSDAGSGAPVLVEFLDLECEACAEVYPTVEELRAEYEGRLSVVARYFPLPGHPNSETAAVAVEAAAGQDAFEVMYQRLYETQEDWSHQEASQAKVFRGYAADLGLDLAAYDAAVGDPATPQRVGQEPTDGQDLGVQGTPTFFLDGQRIEPSSPDHFRELVEQALAATD